MVYTANWGLYGTYHLLREPGNSIDSLYPSFRCQDTIFYIQRAVQLNTCTKHVRYGPYNYLTGVFGLGVDGNHNQGEEKKMVSRKGIENLPIIEHMSITPLRFNMVGPKNTASLLRKGVTFFPKSSFFGTFIR